MCNYAHKSKDCPRNILIHYLHPMNLYCRFRKIFNKAVSKWLSKWYEKTMWKLIKFLIDMLPDTEDRGNAA